MFSVNCAVDVFPATSKAVPLTAWLVPSLDSICSAGQVAIPERGSAQVNVTVTGDVFHPFKDDAGDAIAVIVGGVRSRFTVAQAVEERPLVSMAVPQNCWFAPSLETVTADGHELIGFVPGEQVYVTVTLLLFQPLEFGEGETDAITVGGVGATV